MRRIAGFWGMLLVVLVAHPAFALGLGAIQVRSHLNEPFSATIPVTAGAPGELESSTVTLASQDEFQRANVQYADYLPTLQFNLNDQASPPVVEVHSDRIAREPYLNFLVQMRWKGGVILREYTVLLDPLNSSASPQAQGSSDSSPAVTAPTSTYAPPPVAPSGAPASSSRPSLVSPPPAPSSAPSAPPPRAHHGRVRPPSETVQVETPPPAAPAAAASAGGSTPSPGGAPRHNSYGPVAEGETLWSVATKVRSAFPDVNLNNEQVCLALFKANPDAFDGGKIGGLHKGRVLHIPPVAELTALSPDAAYQRFHAMVRHSGALPASAGSMSAAESVPAAPVMPAHPAHKALPAAPALPLGSAPAMVPAPVLKVTPPPPKTVAAAPPASRPTPAMPTAPSAMAPLVAAQPVSPATVAPNAAVPASSVAAPVTAASLPKATMAPLVPATSSAAAPARSGGGFPLLPVIAAAALLFLALIGLTLARRKRPPAGGAASTPADPFGVPPAGSSGGGARPASVPPPAPAPAGQTQTQTQIEGAGAVPPPAVDANDPIADADFHIAYGLFDEAATLLKNAIEKHPGRVELQEKLAEVYAAARKPAEFEQVVQRLRGKLGPTEGERIAALRNKLGASAGAGADAGASASFLHEEPTTLNTPQPPKPRSVEKPDPGLSVDLSDFDAEPAPPPPVPPLSTVKPAENRIDFVSDEPTKVPPPPSAAARAAPGAAGVSDPLENELSTKLDLARAYSDMGDNDAARSLLQEVIASSSAAHRAEAEALLGRLGP